jgi:putative membrane-bound dehydrogenase-like protein
MSKLRNRLLSLAAGWSLGAAALAVLAPAPAARAQMTPEETLKTLKAPDGLEVSLFASEPGLVNPTDMDIDSRGRIWVLEAADYRRFKTRPEGDRIMILEDTDGDGKADKYKVFYQDPSLFAPLGICVLGNKVYVAQSPNVLVFDIDETGDHAKGPPKVLFTGFTGVNHDHGVHAGVFGPDGRYYFNGGNESTHDLITYADKTPVVDSLGSEIGAKAKQYRGKPRVKGQIGYTDGMAFRCDLDGKNFETLGWNFRNNYELTVDSFGTVWQSDNDDDGNQGVRINYVMEGGNFGFKNPLTGRDWMRDMKELGAQFPGQTRQEAHWHQRWPGVVPNLLHTGQGSPTGITVYEGNLLPEKYRGALIHADAGTNVIHVFITEPSKAVAVGLMGKPDEYGKEEGNGAGYKVKEIVNLVGLAQKGDRWFRPADVCVAPDGSLFIADWYDPGVGGHNMQDKNPGEKDPTDWHHLRGRVYRVAPAGNKYSVPKLDLASVAGQIEALKSPNYATRYLAWTKLHEGGPEAVKALEKTWSDEKDARIRARALWLLARSADGKRYVEAALKESNPDLRITALRAARLIKMDIPSIADKMLNDDSPAVRRELALAMNYEPADKAVPILVKLADKYDGHDRWYLEAIGIGATGREHELLEAWTKDHKNNDPQVADKLAWRLKPEIPGAAATAANKQASADSPKPVAPDGKKDAIRPFQNLATKGPH